MWLQLKTFQNNFFFSFGDGTQFLVHTGRGFITKPRSWIFKTRFLLGNSELPAFLLCKYLFTYLVLYECFVYMCVVCKSHAYLVPLIVLELGLQMFLSHNVGAWNWTRPSEEQVVLLTTKPFLLSLGWPLTWDSSALVSWALALQVCSTVPSYHLRLQVVISTLHIVKLIL